MEPFERRAIPFADRAAAMMPNLPMNQPLSRPAATLSPPCGERARRGEARKRFLVPMRGQKPWEISMNRTPSSRPSPPVGEKVPGGRLRGIASGSWLRFTSGFWRFSLPLNLVAADVSRRTCLLTRQRISADSRRRLRFRETKLCLRGLASTLAPPPWVEALLPVERLAVAGPRSC